MWNDYNIKTVLHLNDISRGSFFATLAYPAKECKLGVLCRYNTLLVTGVISFDINNIEQGFVIILTMQQIPFAYEHILS